MRICLCECKFIVVILIVINTSHEEEIKPEIVKGWAKQLGWELWEYGNHVTGRLNVIESFKDTTVEQTDGKTMVNELAKEMENVMKLKVAAVKKIADTAQKVGSNYNYDQEVDPELKYYNAKTIKPPGSVFNKCEIKQGYSTLELSPNSYFFDVPVNTNLSIIHVPTSVFFREREALKMVVWTEQLESVFLENYKNDPGLTWQYFGSSTGLMRHFPAMAWPVKDPIPDMFDCRLRSWYMEAAAGPKDVVILLDNSGSMRSEEKIEISQLLVNTILETLGHNDFVNIIAFVNDTNFIVPCYEGSLVQANMENIRELKLGLIEMQEAQNITNFVKAFSDAFHLLEEYRTKRQGATCNQAIMLITDGVDKNYKEIFEEYNWKNLPFIPVRIFTFLLGQEAADVEDIKWMACKNRGYYVHINTMGEVRDQVLKYIPVMARPMVLAKADSPVIWTPFYADTEDPAMTDWLWNVEESKEQKERSMSFRQNHKKFSEPVEKRKRIINKLRRMQDQSAGENKFRFMTSVAKAAIDFRDVAKVKLGKDCNELDPTCQVEPVEMRVAFILGVAGTDMTLEEIKQRLKPHWLGVNAYSFVVTNNGYVLVHPDLRPVFQGILKPGYNSVDFTDVELVDDDRGPLNFSQTLLEFRKKLVDGTTSSCKSLPMKHHYDNMKRVMKGIRHYYYKPIENSPFTLVITLPDLYGHYNVEGILSVNHLQKMGRGKLSIFEGNWNVHPDWIYCKYRMQTYLASPEEEVEHFFSKIQSANWEWPMRNQTDIQCDRNLFLSLMYDAKATSWFSKYFRSASPEDKRKEFRQRFGLIRVFLATRSGLTRWQDFPDTLVKAEPEDTMYFKDIPNRAIDEVWYRRAVEHNYEEPNKFVFSIPFNSGVLGSEIPMKHDAVITASNAIFVESDGKKAPAAVVGFQVLHSAIHDLFLNITYKCPGPIGSECKQRQHTCASNNFECYVVDSNAYIVLSKNKKYIGYFFGEIHGFIMGQMVAQNIFWRTRIYDYQGVCFVEVEDKTDKNSCSVLRNPLHFLSWFGRSILSNILWFLAEFNLNWVVSLAYTSEEEVFDKDLGEIYMNDAVNPPRPTPTEDFSNVKYMLRKVMINRTLPEPCSLEVDLYRALPEQDHIIPERTSSSQCDTLFHVQSIPNTDLLLVIVHANCPRAFEGSLNVIPSEVTYNGNTFNCRRKNNNLPRRRPSICIKEHPREEEILICGMGCQLLPCLRLEFISLIIITLIKKHQLIYFIRN